MNTLLDCTANILEKVAVYLDFLEQDKSQAAKEQQMKFATEIKTKLGSVMGSGLDDSLVEKLSSADPEIMQLLSKVASSVENVDPLGGPGESGDTMTGPLNKKDELKLANQKFEAWILS